MAADVASAGYSQKKEPQKQKVLIRCVSAGSGDGPGGGGMGRGWMEERARVAGVVIMTESIDRF